MSWTCQRAQTMRTIGAIELDETNWFEIVKGLVGEIRFAVARTPQRCTPNFS